MNAEVPASPAVYPTVRRTHPLESSLVTVVSGPPLMGATPGAAVLTPGGGGAVGASVLGRGQGVASQAAAPPVGGTLPLGWCAPKPAHYSAEPVPRVAGQRGPAKGRHGGGHRDKFKLVLFLGPSRELPGRLQPWSTVGPSSTSPPPHECHSKVPPKRGFHQWRFIPSHFSSPEV